MVYKIASERHAGADYRLTSQAQGWEPAMLHALEMMNHGTV